MYLNRFLYKKPGNEEYISLDRIEDLFVGFRGMLAWLVEDLVFKGKLNEAKGIVLRHNINRMKDDTREALAKVKYDPNKDPVPYDVFGPLTEDCIGLPEDVDVEWISRVNQLERLNVLLKEPYIGVDAEWRPSLTRFHDTKPALFQISGEKIVFLIDLISLGDSSDLDKKLQQIFCNEKSVIVGFSFNSDIDMFARKFPKMQFYRYIKRFVDAQTYFARIYLAGPQTGLAKVIEKVFG